MKETFGFQPLSYELITLLESGPPDFQAAEELLRKGADINDSSTVLDENVLSDILLGYCDTCLCNDPDKSECDYKSHDCLSCPKSRNPNSGESMLQIIQFFLDHGFDLNRENGCYGAMCLTSLKFSTYDRYIVNATKLLLSAGAQNVPPYEDDDDSLLAIYDTEYSYQVCCENNYFIANIMEAVYMIYLALEEGRDYSSIDAFEASYSKTIFSVMAESMPDGSSLFERNFEHSHQTLCFIGNLYLCFQEACLIISDYGSIWVDRLPVDKQLIDVSDRFPEIINRQIDHISFDPMEYVKLSPYDGIPTGAICFANGSKLLVFYHHTGPDKERFSYICSDKY